MQPFPIVHVLDELFNPLSGHFECPVLPQVDFLNLQGLHEALGLGVVLRVALSAHADLEAVLIQGAHIRSAGIFDASVRVVNAASRWTPGGDGGFQRLAGQLRIQPPRQCPTGHFPRPGIQQHG